MAEIETKTLIDVIAKLGNQTIKEAVNGDIDKVAEIVKKDFTDPAFYRGYLNGLRDILGCEGIPTFLTGVGVLEIQTRLLIISGNIDKAHVQSVGEKVL